MVFVASQPIPRRQILRGFGVALALPLFEASRASTVHGSSEQAPRRLFAICTNMGMMPQFFKPISVGRDYQPSPYLAHLQKHRDDFTVFSGLSHPDVDGGHRAEVSFLTAAPHPGGAGFRNSISLDQYAAERIGTKTRFPYLTLNVGVAGSGLSWTSSGAAIPAESRPSSIFRRLFVQGSPAEVEEQLHRLDEGRSILDSLADRTQSLKRQLGANDQRKLDQYFTSIRELEQRLLRAQEWEHRSKPTVAMELPVDIDEPGALIERTRLMFQIAVAAFESDSTRIITLKIDENNNPRPLIDGVAHGHHSLTHHGLKQESIEELKLIETAQMRVVGELLDGLANSSEQGRRLFDNTIVLYGSNLGNANSHDNRNLPILLAGGGYQHSGHVAFDSKKNQPLSNLFVSILQRLGIETDRFADSTGTISPS